MDIKLYAAILLIARLISMGFIFAVIVKQFSLFKLPIERESEMAPEYRRKLKYYRITLFALAVTVFIGNLVPAGIDLLTIFADLERTARTVKPTSLVYTMSWAVIGVLSSYLIWRLYYLSRQVDKSSKLSNHSLLKEAKKKNVL